MKNIGSMSKEELFETTWNIIDIKTTLEGANEKFPNVLDGCNRKLKELYSEISRRGLDDEFNDSINDFTPRFTS